MCGMFGWQELLIILAIVLIIFGVGKLPDIGAGLGKGIKEFKKASSSDEIEAAKVEDKEESEKKDA